MSIAFDLLEHLTVCTDPYGSWTTDSGSFGPGDGANNPLWGDDYNPVGNVKVTVTLAGGRTVEKELDGEGKLTIESVPPGVCTLQVALPDRAKVGVPTVDDKDFRISVRVPRLMPPPGPMPPEPGKPRASLRFLRSPCWPGPPAPAPSRPPR